MKKEFELTKIWNDKLLEYVVNEAVRNIKIANETSAERSARIDNVIESQNVKRTNETLNEEKSRTCGPDVGIYFPVVGRTNGQNFVRRDLYVELAKMNFIHRYY